MSQGADCNAKSEKGESCLFLACLYGKKKCVKQLLLKNVNVFEKPTTMYII